jgi:hypothetical protein
MSAVGVLLAVLAALLVGYAYGRRNATPAPTWRQRTSRTALGRRAATLAFLVTAAHLQRRVQRRYRRRPASFRRW